MLAGNPEYWLSPPHKGFAMGQQPIIRNVTTMDRRPVVRVTTEDVLKAVRAHQGDFTTYDIARVLSAEEYPARAAMIWLVKRGIIERVGIEERLLSARARRLRCKTYTVARYRVKPEATEIDFAALNRAFGYG